jgi:hypothetical protein
MTQIRWGEFLAMFTCFAFGTYLLVTGHETAGGWLIAIGALAMLSVSFDRSGGRK